MTARFGQECLTQIGKMKPIDIAEAVIYALSAPQRVNVSKYFNKTGNNIINTIL